MRTDTPLYDELLQLHLDWLESDEFEGREKLRERLLRNSRIIRGNIPGRRFPIPSLDAWMRCVPGDSSVRVEWSSVTRSWHASVVLYGAGNNLPHAGYGQSERALDAFLLALSASLKRRLHNIEQGVHYA